MTLPRARVQLRHALFWTDGDRANTWFPDGLECSNWVPRGPGGEVLPDFAAEAAACDLDPDRYLVQHELLHSLVPEILFDRPGYVVRMMARQKPADLAASYAEERMFGYVARLIARPLTFPCPDQAWHLVVDCVRDLRIGWGWWD